MQRSYHSKLLKNRVKIILLVLVATTTIALTVIARPFAHLTLTAWSNPVDDASYLNQTQVTIKQVKSQPGVTEVLLQSVLRDALRQDKKVAIAAIVLSLVYLKIQHLTDVLRCLEVEGLL